MFNIITRQNSDAIRLDKHVSPEPAKDYQRSVTKAIEEEAYTIELQQDYVTRLYG